MLAIKVEFAGQWVGDKLGTLIPVSGSQSLVVSKVVKHKNRPIYTYDYE